MFYLATHSAHFIYGWLYGVEHSGVTESLFFGGQGGPDLHLGRGGG